MFSIDSYLSGIGYAGPTEPTAATLRELHRRHLMTLPFDNSAHTDEGTGVLANVDVDLDATFDSTVRGRRGGVCFELNGLFRVLLTKLGYQVDILSAGVRGPGGTFGPDLEHMFLGVHIDGELWLADVGFAGPGYVEPLLVADGLVQSHLGCDYRITQQNGYFVVDRRTRLGEWAPVYRFTRRARELSEWLHVGGDPSSEDDAWNWEGELVAAGTVIQARSFDGGQMVLVGKRYLRIDDGVEKVRVLIKPDEYRAVSAHIVGGAD
jgi:amide synthase